MATFSTSEFKNGLKVLIDGEPCSILENEVVKPGKGQAFNRVRMRNLKNGRVWERTYKSGESLEGALLLAQAKAGEEWGLANRPARCARQTSAGLSWETAPPLIGQAVFLAGRGSKEKATLGDR